MNKLHNYFLAILTVIITFTSTGCKLRYGNNPLPTGDMVCDKSGKEIFDHCLIEHVQVGSSYQELKSFLELHNFVNGHPTPNPDQDYKFNFNWNDNTLWNYHINVIGRTNSDLEVIEMKINY